MLSKFGYFKIKPYFCCENKNAEAMKPKTKDTIIVVLMGIALISFLVVL